MELAKMLRQQRLEAVIQQSTSTLRRANRRSFQIGKLWGSLVVDLKSVMKDMLWVLQGWLLMVCLHKMRAWAVAWFMVGLAPTRTSSSPFSTRWRESLMPSSGGPSSASTSSCSLSTSLRTEHSWAMRVLTLPSSVGLLFLFLND